MTDDDFWATPLAQPTLPPPRDPVACENLGSGEHAGLLWHVQQFGNVGGRTVTVSGWVGPHYVFQQVEMDAPTPAAVKRFCEAVAAEAAARKRGRK